MTKTNTIIQLNGKSFDAVTGHPVAAPVAVHHQPKHSRSIDGVVRPGSKAVAPKTRPAPTAATPIKAAPSTNKKTHTPAPSAKTHATHNSKTLMRHVVTKPSTLGGSKLQAVVRTDILAQQPSTVVQPKLSIAGVDKRREARAKRVAKSKLVSRFGSIEVGTTPIVYSPVQDPAVSLPLAPVAPAPLQHHIPRIAPPTGQRSMDIFQRALTQATSHEQPAPPKKRAHATNRRKRARSHRFASVTSASLAVLLIGGFLAYQNVANVKLHMASSKAGFAATLPGYKPSGFSIGKFAYSPGNVTIDFHSNSDSRSFAITEQPSGWDSTTLLNDFVAVNSPSYQTVQAAGRTIYVSDKTATWVNNGIWYQVNTQNALSPRQLTSLASSM